jgi:hypothetical protein
MRFPTAVERFGALRSFFAHHVDQMEILMATMPAPVSIVTRVMTRQLISCGVVFLLSQASPWDLISRPPSVEPPLRAGFAGEHCK